MVCRFLPIVNRFLPHCYVSICKSPLQYALLELLPQLHTETQYVIQDEAPFHPNCYQLSPIKTHSTRPEALRSTIERETGAEAPK